MHMYLQTSNQRKCNTKNSHTNKTNKQKQSDRKTTSLGYHDSTVILVLVSKSI